MRTRHAFPIALLCALAAVPSAYAQEAPPTEAPAAGPSQADAAAEAPPPEPAAPSPDPTTKPELPAPAAAPTKAQPAPAAAATPEPTGDALLAGAAETDDALGTRAPASLYGFFDFGFNKFYTSDRSQIGDLFPSKAGTFVLGNVNVFFDAQPWEDWRSLIEIRFTNLPHGVERGFGTPLGDQYQRDDTSVEDFTSPSLRGNVTLGSIVIERVQAEYGFSDAAKLMGGYFFTPFGIWNVDHGTPTLISLLLPSFISDDTIARRVLGAQLYGSAYGGSWELGYHAWLGNSRSPSQVDFDDDKAFGGRIFASSSGSALKLKLGASGYYSTYTDISKQVVSATPFEVDVQTTAHFREITGGVDLSLDAGPLRLRLEGVLQDVLYDADKVPSYDIRHSRTYDGYAIAAYQLPWLGLEPYGYFEAIRWHDSLGDTVLIPSAGLNIHFNPAVQFKAQYAHAMFFDWTGPAEDHPSYNNVDNISARLVVSF